MNTSNRKSFLLGILCTLCTAILMNAGIPEVGMMENPVATGTWRSDQTINWIHAGWNIGANSVSGETVSATDTVSTQSAFVIEGTLSTAERLERIAESESNDNTYIYRIETLDEDELSSIHLAIDGVEYPTQLIAAASATAGDPLRVAMNGQELAFASLELER